MKGLKRHVWWGVLVILTIFGVCHLRVNTDILDLLPPDQPEVQGLKAYQQYFANAHELIVTLRTDDAEAADKLAEALARRLRQESNLVTSVSWQPPWMENPAQAAEIVAYLWFNQPPDSFRGLTNRLAADNLKSLLAESREVLATSLSPMDIAQRAFDPYNLLSVPALKKFNGISAEQGQRMFVSADGKFRILYLQARPALADYRECAVWLGAIQLIVDEVRGRQAAGNNSIVRYTGRPVFVTEIASSMQRDLKGSLVGTAAIIALLFWLMHRRWLPMLWLLLLLALILILTVAIGSLILGAISVISLGFAAVLLGLAVDYAVVHYQEALSHPQLSIPEVRRLISPSILWAAITTISAFLVLNFGGLPGLAQLGSLVAIGVTLAALVMVLVYLPPLFPRRRQSSSSGQPRASWLSYLIPPQTAEVTAIDSAGQQYCRRANVVTIALILGTGIGLFVYPPRLDQTANALKPQHSEAEAALGEMAETVGIPQDPLWIMISGRDEPHVFEQFSKAETILQQAVSDQVVSGFLLPAVMWPRVEYQRENRAVARVLASQGTALRAAAVAEGFQTNALFLTDELLKTWHRAGTGTAAVFWPTNDMSQWLLKRFVARSTNEWFAMGLVYPATNAGDATQLAALSQRLAGEHLLLSSWKLLAGATLKKVQSRFWWMVLPMILLVCGSLWLAFRRAAEVLLGLAVLLASSGCLLAVMSIAGWSWNLLNLMAVPLILGTGVDYSIFMQLALRRHAGDVVLVRRSIGRALLLCGGTAITGFGALGFSSHAGMASLGQICAVGVGANMLISIWLLPAWWRQVHRTRPLQAAAPSAFYGAWIWRFGLGIVRLLSARQLGWLFTIVAELYYRLNRRRRQIVVQNLLPVVKGNQAAAERAAHELFRQFAHKMKDLLRYECGLAVEGWQMPDSDWAVFDAARARGKGVLLVTPHLGNWEVGGPEMVKRGVKLVAITQAEPGPGLTELRQQSRARWGIETIVVGGDGFAFVEIIKRLQEGATIALLVDRPQGEKAVTVTLFDRPFQASAAAAELARATGCALIGVTIVRSKSGYEACLLPEFVYDRQALGNRPARFELTQQILRAFEAKIQQYPEQWFHFVPIWPKFGAFPRQPHES